jgi:uncharacterized membrane protein
MERIRAVAIALAAFCVTMLAVTSTAVARAYGGEGWWGETSDKTITYAMYVVIVLFPTIIVLFSVIQWRLDRRKHARMAAAKRRAASLDWRGGW